MNDEVDDDIKQNVYLYLWCREYGLPLDVFKCLKERGTTKSAQLFALLSREVEGLELSGNFKDMLQHAVALFRRLEHAANDSIHEQMISFWNQEKWKTSE